MQSLHKSVKLLLLCYCYLIQIWKQSPLEELAPWLEQQGCRQSLNCSSKPPGDLHKKESTFLALGAPSCQLLTKIKNDDCAEKDFIRECQGWVCLDERSTSLWQIFFCLRIWKFLCRWKDWSLHRDLDLRSK